MAGQAGSSDFITYAQDCGNGFVRKYYSQLKESPKQVSKFYKDTSRLTRAEAGPTGEVHSVSTMSEINEKLMALQGGGGFKVDVATVDSQDTAMGYLLVIVTGSIQYENLTGKKDFVQAFILDPIEDGYFVQHDIFRYLDKDKPTEQEKRVHDYATDSDSSVPGIPPVVNHPRPSLVAPPGPVACSLDANEPHVSVETYSSILRKDYDGLDVSFTTNSPKATTPPDDPQASSSSATVSSSGPEFVVDIRSVYVKNLSSATSPSRLESEFQKFGDIVSGEVHIKKNYRGVIYAFIKFEKTASAQSAIESSPIHIDGSPVYIEERKPRAPPARKRGGKLNRKW